MKNKCGQVSESIFPLRPHPLEETSKSTKNVNFKICISRFSKSPLIIHHNLIGSKENWKTACMASLYQN